MAKISIKMSLKDPILASVHLHVKIWSVQGADNF